MDIALKGFQRKKFVRIYRKTGCFPGLVERGVVFVAKPPKCYKGAARSTQVDFISDKAARGSVQKSMESNNWGCIEVKSS